MMKLYLIDWLSLSLKLLHVIAGIAWIGASFYFNWLENKLNRINNRDEIDIIENNSKPSCTNCAADVFPAQMNSQYFQADENLIPQTVRIKGNFRRSNLSSLNL